MRSNMIANAPHHLYKNLKFSKLSEFSDVCNSHPPPHVNYRVREPHVSHTGINMCAHCPLHLPKKVTEKPSVNHIGSSTSHQWKMSQPGISLNYKKINSRRFSNRSWTYWSERESKSEKDAKDCVDANESTQTKSESDVTFAFAWSALTLRVTIFENVRWILSLLTIRWRLYVAVDVLKR